LPDADIGFAFLPQFWSQGYAYEAAAAAMRYGREVLRFAKILAITTQDNESSCKLLLKLGFQYDGLIKTPPDEVELKLFSAAL
jgi:RimJ/RimL family protein N-acetyltransferase